MTIVVCYFPGGIDCTLALMVHSRALAAIRRLTSGDKGACALARDLGVLQRVQELSGAADARVAQEARACANLLQ